MSLKKRQPQTKFTLDGQEYVAQLYSPTFGLTLHYRLIALLGEPLIKAMGVVKGAGIKGVADLANLDPEKLDLSALSDAVALVFGKLPPDQFTELVKEILSNTFLSPSLTAVTDEFESHFAGQYGHLFKLVVKTLGVQFPDFLSVIAKRSSAASAASASSGEAMK
jgi:hypothetical protein